VAAGPEVCSPLDGIEIAVLNQPDLLKNPFAPPQPGKDDGHFGIDLAYWADAEGRPMQGLPVRAALAGVVAGVIQNRYPYGNAVIIETPLDNISPQLLARLDLPEPSGELHPAQSLTCPEYAFTPPSASRSLYTLYAHLEQPPLVEAGQTVACGDPLGAVGTTGRSVNPHLHLEARAGPAGMVFPSMAHYDTSASADEMRLYCLWRVSGAFEAFDPLNLFGLEMPAAVK
jgi:murein DD-endopeptidase MepM/ murein hydrolase activator NlpD